MAIFFFTDNLDESITNGTGDDAVTIQGQNKVQSFGVKSQTEFQVTSCFTMSNSNKAYAVSRGTILLQQQTDHPEKVNLILKPIDKQGLKMPVKYFVYRGLQTTSFLTGTNLETAAVLTDKSSELLKELEATQRKRINLPEGEVTIPKGALFGHTLTTNIDDFFYYRNESAPTQLFMVEAGMELGTFAAGEGGMEIILENPDLEFTVAKATKEKYEIVIATEDMNTAKGKWEREQIRHFVDPAAFYGLHHDSRDGIGYNGKTNIAKGTQAVYENIVNRFYTKNAIYLDIRSEHGYSYNYYDEYPNGNIQIKDENGEFVENSFYTDGWAIYTIGHVQEIEAFNALTFDVSLQKTNANNDNYNSAPILIGRYAQNFGKNQIKSKDIVERNNLFLIDNIEFEGSENYPTKYVTIVVPAFSTNNVWQQIATIVRLDYIKKTDVNNDSPFGQKTNTDFLFGPIDAKISLATDTMKWETTYIDRFSNNEDEITVWNSGMVKETTAVLYYFNPKTIFKSKKITKASVRKFPFGGSTSLKPTFFKEFESITRVEKHECTFENKEISVIKYQDSFLDKIRTDDNAYFLGITEKQRDNLINVVNDTLSKYHHRFFKLVELGKSEESEEVVAYNLYVVGYSKTDNSYTSVSEVENELITVYTIDKKK
jgi:hypothetical protein